MLQHIIMLILLFLFKIFLDPSKFRYNQPNLTYTLIALKFADKKKRLMYNLFFIQLNKLIYLRNNIFPEFKDK